DELERLTGRRVYGTLPWEPGLWLDAEDSLAPKSSRTEETAPQVVVEGEGRGQRARRVAVVRLPRISNFTDVDALGLEPDLVVLPGTRSTLADLAWLRSRGLDRALVEHTGRGRPLLGICGGFQMLGTTLTDQDGVETEAGMHVEGLGLLDVRTDFTAEKTLGLPFGKAFDTPVRGYQMHHGQVTVGRSEEFLGGARSGNVFGTTWHGTLEGDAFRAAFLAEVLGSEPSGVDFAAARERRLDLLADLVEQHLDVDALLTLVHGGTPT